MRYFKEREVNCPCGCGATLAPHVKQSLDELRELYGKPVYIEQGATCKEYSVNHVGRKPTSTHIDHGNGALAVDIKRKTFDNKNDVFRFIKAAHTVGFKGFGIGIGHLDVHKRDKRLHIDIRESFDVVTWVYYDKE